MAPKDNNPSSSADFNSFGESGTDLSSIDQDYEYDLGYIETDRIDPKQIDPNAVIYSANSAPYGEQYPSYLPKSMATMVSYFTTNYFLLKCVKEMATTIKPTVFALFRLAEMEFEYKVIIN